MHKCKLAQAQAYAESQAARREELRLLFDAKRCQSRDMENVQRPSDEATKNILFDLADLRYEHHNEDSDISRFKARAVKWAVDAVTDLGEVIPSDVATMVKARYASRIAARPTPTNARALTQAGTHVPRHLW